MSSSSSTFFSGSREPTAERQIYFSVAKESGKQLTPMKGDTDFVDKLLEGLQITLGKNQVVYIDEALRGNNSKVIIKADAIVDHLLSKPAGTEPSTLHIILNLPSLSGGYTKEHLEALKKKGYQIAITCVEFAKYAGRDEKLQITSMALLGLADKIIFLDEADKYAAIKFTTKDIPALTSAAIISVPATTVTANKPFDARENNIISFGIVRNGKGLHHVIELAEELKSAHNAGEKKLPREVMIVGSMDSTFYLPGFVDVLKRIFPVHSAELDNLEQQWAAATKVDKQMKDAAVSEVTEAIKQSVEKWQSNSADIALPVRFYFDNEPAKLVDLFNQAKYSFLPAYRGMTLRNSSISSSLANDFVTYSHKTDITPSLLASYPEAVVLLSGIDSSFITNKSYETEKYAKESGYAKRVLDDIRQREANPDLNKTTIASCQELVKDHISLPTIGEKIVAIYEAKNVNNSIRYTF